MENGLKNVHVNIRSLKYKIQEVKNIVQNNSPHILGLSEAELKKSTTDISTLKIPGYDILFPKSWEVNGTARIILYVKKSLDYERVDNLENTSIQSIWIRGNFKHSKKMYFCHAYREHWDNFSLPNQRNKLDLFLSQWEAALEYDNPVEPNEVRVSLDMNLDSYQGKWLQPTYKYVSLARIVQNYCDIGNFTQLVKEPTRLMYNSVSKTIEKSCIDHIYTNAKSWCSNPTIIPFGASDHDIILYTRYTKLGPTNCPTIRGRSYKKFNSNKFLQDLQKVNWIDVLICQDLDEAVRLFTTKFNLIYNMHAPWIVYQKRKNFVPWISDDLKYYMKERDNWKQKLKEIKIYSNGIHTHAQEYANCRYKFYRNKINNMKKYDENNYKKKIFEENKHSAQLTWKISKKFMNWKSSGSPHQILSNNIIEKKAFQVAEIVNNFFHDKVQIIRNSIPHILWTPDSCKNIMEGKNCRLNLQFPTQKEVLNVLKNLSNSKCSAIDGLDNFSVKMASDYIILPVHHIITLSIMQEKFPETWKLAKVTPLHKKDDILLPENYRPVSILSPLSKVLEKVVYKQLYGYLTRNKIIHPCLHGYRKDRSTLTALLQMYESWVKSASEGQVSCGIFIDLSAAFDLVPKEILYSKLKIYGISSCFVEFIRSYLTDRKQAVWIDNCYSNFKPCELGVPQGSILGPLIFLLFVNDLSFILTCEKQQYADDTTLSATGKNIDTISEILTSNCETLSKWMSMNKLKLNAGKTHVLTVGTQRRLGTLTSSICVHMNGVRLIESETGSETLLGCVIQNNLKWNQNIKKLKEKLKKRITGVYKIKHVVPFQTLKVISEGWFTSVLSYCLPLFGGCEKQNINDLQVIQNKLARIVTKSDYRTSRTFCMPS